MKNLIKITALLFLAFSLFSCGETAEEKTPEEERRAAMDPSRENRENRPLQKDEWTVSEAIEMWVENLDIRLSVSQEVKGKIKEAYMNEYAKRGESFETKIKKEAAMKLRKELVKGTQNEVLPLLTEDQKVYYKRFIKD